MRDVYDNPQDTFVEQAEKSPRGPLGLLEPPRVSLTSDLPPEVEDAVRQFVAGDLGAMELALRLEAIRRKSAGLPAFQA